MKLNLFFFLPFFFFALVSCEEKRNATPSHVESIVYDTLKNEYAKGFQLIYSSEGTIVNVLDPLTGELIKNYSIGKGEAYNVFSDSLHNVVALSTTHIGMLRKLGLESRISGVASYQHLCHPMNITKVHEVGDIGMTDPERILKASPDIIFYSGYNLNAPILNKLERVDKKTFLIYDWKETHPLGRAEWLKVFGVLFGKEKEAHNIFTEMKTNYHRIVTNLKEAKHQPTVLAGTYFGDVFNVPAGDSYMAHLLKDANVNYVYSEMEGVGSLNLGLEEVITKNLEVDYWINVAFNSFKDLIEQSAKFSMLKSVKTGQVYTYINDVNCFWENSPVEPDKVLEDFGKIFHPELMEESELIYYSRLANQ